MAAYVCARCTRGFESTSEVPRCPTCLRKSSVRAADDSEIARLARGESTGTAGARAGLLLTTLALAAPGLAGISLFWRPLLERGLALPAVAGELVAVSVWSRAALAPADPARPLAAYVPRAAIGAALGAWAFVAGAIGAQAGSDAPLFTVGIAVVLFGGGVVAALQWLRDRESPVERTSGKWR